MAQLCSLQLPREGVPTKAPPILPDYIDSLQRILGKVVKDILPTHSKDYSQDILSSAPSSTAAGNFILPQEGQFELSLEVQPDDMTGGHRDGEHSPLERPQVSKKEVGGCKQPFEHRSEKRFRFSNRGWDEPRNITSRRSSFRNGDVSATARDDIKKHR